MVIYEYVLRFKISMKDSFGVNIGDTIENFFEDYFGFLLIRLVIFACNILLEIVVVIIEHDLEQLLFGFIEDVDEGYDVRVFFECFQERYLSQGTRGYSFFFSLELDVLDSHKFIVFVDRFEHFPKSTLPDDAQLSKSISFFHLFKIL